MDYDVIETIGLKNKFIVVEKDNPDNIILDGNGFGYKTKPNAFAAANYTFNGGKEKADKSKKDFRDWKKVNQKVVERFEEILNISFDELLDKSTSIEDVFKTVESEFDIKISKPYRRLLMK